MREISFPESFSEAASVIPQELFAAAKHYAATGQYLDLVKVALKIEYLIAVWLETRSRGGVSISTVDSEAEKFLAACIPQLEFASDEPVAGEVSAQAFGDRIRNLAGLAGKLRNLKDLIGGGLDAIGSIDPETWKSLLSLVTTIIGFLPK